MVLKSSCQPSGLSVSPQCNEAIFCIEGRDERVMSELKIALWQMNAKVGDFVENAAKIRAAARRAEQLGAGLLLTPEMSLVGYPAEDWILRDDFC